MRYFRSTSLPIESLESRVLLSGTTLAWQTVAPMPVPRAEGGSFVADGRLYTFGGFNNANLDISNEMDYYDPATNHWTRVADAPVRVNDDPVAVDPVTDTAWIGGFYLNDGFHPSGLVYSYNIKTNVWTQGPSLPTTIGAGGMAVVGRELHYWGGRDKNNIGTTAHWRLNLDNISAGWIADTPIPKTTNHVGTAVVNGKIYSIGGIVNKNEYNSNEANVWVYDPSTRQWTAGASMPFGLGHIASAATVYGNKIITAGGEVDGTKDVMTKAVLEYDVSANTWTRLTDLPDFRQSSYVAAVDNKLIVTGGNQYFAPYVNATTWAADLDPAGSISGNIFSDTNGNGVRDAGESPLVGWGVFLDVNNNGVFDAGADTRVFSDANGNYTFGGLSAGQYHLVENASADWIRTVPAGSSYTVDLTDGQVVTGKNFGAAQSVGSISGTIFSDANGNGIQDAGEPGLIGWGVFLDFNANGVFDPGVDVRVFSDASGHFSFTSLTAGRYHVAESTPSGWNRTVPSGSSYSIDLAAFQNVTGQNFGAQPPTAPAQNLASISGNIFNDLNGNGVLDFGEPGLIGWGVFLDANNNGVFDDGIDTRVFSDANGNYTFTNLAAGQYQLAENTPADWARTAPLGSVYAIDLTPAQILTGKNFGVNQSGISGTVFNDLNGNGVQNAGEPGLIGWGVFLDFNNNGIFDPGVDVRFFSDINGHYFMTNLSPGVYHLVENTPTGWTRTTPLSSRYTVTLALFQTATGWNFGARQNS